MTAPALSLGYASALNAPATVLQIAGTQSVSKDGFVNFPNDALTVSLWLKTSSTDTGAAVFGYDADGQDVSHQIVLRNPANLEIVIGANPPLSTGVAVNTDRWLQIALVVAPYGGAYTAVTLYIDGAVRFSAAGALGRTEFESAATLVLGRAAIAGQGNSLAGLYSEFRLWSGARSAGQIVTDMMVRASALPAQPLEYWPLDQAPPDATLNGNPVFVSSSLAFRTQTLTASWTQIEGADSYNLYVQDLGGCWRPMTTGLTGLSTAVPDYTLNAVSQGMVQAVVGAQPGDWSAVARANLFNLAPLSPALQADAQAVTLSLAWTAVDQAPKTQYAVYQDGAGAPTIAETTALSQDLTSLMKDAGHWWTYTVRPDSTVGSTGPASGVVATAQPALTFVFQNDASNIGALQASWPAVAGAAYLYLRVERISGAPGLVAEALLQGSAISAAPAAELTEGETLRATMRGLALGTIGQWSPAQTVTVHRFPPPYISDAVGDGDAHTIRVSWAIDSQTPGIVFTLQLYDSTGQTLIQQQTAASSPYTFTDPAIVNGKSYKVRIQATLTGSVSLWSAWRDVSVAALPAVPLNAPSVNDKNDITVSWSRPAGLPDGASYVVSINSPTPQTQTLGASATTTTFNQSDTKVEHKKTYTISMHAQQGAQQGPVTSVDVETKPTKDPGHGDKKDDPVNTSDGSYGYSQKLLTLPNPTPIEFGVFYATTRPSHAENPLVPDLPLGPRWTHVYATRIVTDASKQRLAVLWGDGPIDQYAIPASVIGPYAKLGAQSGDSLSFGQDQLYRLRRKDQSLFVFNAQGVLQTMISAIGNTLALTYDGQGRLLKVSDPNTDKSLTFAHLGSGLLQRVTDNGGRAVSFTYDNGNLATITNAGGGVRTIRYTGDALIESVNDENNNVLVKNTYQSVLDSQRVTFQQDGRAVAGGQSYGSSFAYRRETIDQVDFVVCDYVDREGNPQTLRGIEANGCTVETNTPLDGGNLEHVSSTYDGNANLLTRRVYRGPAAGYAPGKGNLWSFTYDGANNLLTSTDPLGRTVTRTYDEKNRLTSIADPLGNVMTYHYEDDLLQWVEDFAGRRTRYDYYSGAIKGLLKTLTDSSGNTYGLVYDANGQVQTATDPFGNVTEFAYYPAGQVRQVTTKTAAGGVLLTRTFEYWGDGSIKIARLQYPGQSEADAFVTSYDYNPDGSVHASVNAAGDALTFGYDANALLTSVDYPSVDSIARRATYTYDRNDFPQSETASAALGITTAYVYDQLGELISITDPEQRVYSYAYETVKVSDTLYNDKIVETLPLLEGQQDAVGLCWLSDPAGRLLAVIDAEGRTTSYAYSSVLDPQTQRNNLIVTETLPPVETGDASYTRIYEFGPVNRLVRYTDEAGKITGYAYGVEQDPDNHLYYQTVTRTDPAGRITVIGVDPIGRTASITLGQGAEAIKRSYAYDALGRMTQSIETGPNADPIVTTFAYSYDAAEKAVKVTLTRNASQTPFATRYLDGLGRLIKEIDPDGAARAYAYCAWGGLERFVEPSQKTFQYGFDAAGRFNKTVLPDASAIERTLDKNGNVTTVTGAGGAEILRTYDAWNRLRSRTDSAGRTVGYAYTSDSALQTLTYSDGKAVAYDYDGLGRMKTVTDWAQRVTTYGYDPIGRVTEISAANGTAATLGYDDAGELLSVLNTTGANIISQLTYTLNSAGLRKTADVIASCAPDFQAGQTTLTYNDSDQVTTFDGLALERTPDGGLATLPAAGGSTTVAYDDCGRVRSIGDDTYAYDLEGHRVQTVLGGVTRNYLIDAGAYRDPRINYPLFARFSQAGLFVDAQGAATLLPQSGAPAPGQRRQVTQPLDRSLEIHNGQDEITQRMIYGLGLIAMESTTGGYAVFHYDSRGSTVALSDASGRVTDRYAYDIYGALNGHSGTSDNPYRYNGRDGVMDDGNGVFYMRSRSYTPQMFNFLQRDILFGDPFAPQSLDRYAFVRNNPIGLVDPLGYSGSRDVWKWILGAGGAALAIGAGVAIYYLGPSFMAGLGMGLSGEIGGLGGLGRVGRLGERFGRWISRRASPASRPGLRQFGERLITRFNQGYVPVAMEMGEIGGGLGSMGSSSVELGSGLGNVSEDLSLLSEGSSTELDTLLGEGSPRSNIPTQQQFDFTSSPENTSGLRYRGAQARGRLNLGNESKKNV